MRSALFLVFFLALVPVCFFRPFVGILAWTWIDYLNPHRFTWGFAQQLPVALLVAIATVLGFVFSKRRSLPPLTLETILLLLLWFWYALTTVGVYFSPEFFHHFPETIARLTFVSKILLMTFFAIMIVNDRQRLHWWYLVTAGSLALLSLKGFVFGLATGGQYRIYGPADSMLTDNNAFALALNMCLPMFFFLAKVETRRWIRFALWGSFVISIVTVILTYSRGGLIGLSVVALALAFKSKHRLAAITTLVLAGLLVLTFAPEKWTARMGTIQTAREKDASAHNRINSWTLAVRIALDYPILGGGFDTFTAPVYDRYSLREEADVLGPHSIYFQILAEHGFPGLLLFLGLICSSLWSCWKVQRTFSRNTVARWPAAYANMVFVSLLGYAASGAFLGLAYFDLFYQVIGTAAIVKYLARQELARERTENLESPSEARVVPQPVWKNYAPAPSK